MDACSNEENLKKKKKQPICYQITCSNSTLFENIIAPSVKRQVCLAVKQPVFGVGRTLRPLLGGIKEHKQKVILSRFADLPSARPASRTQVAVSSFHHAQTEAD